MEISSARFIISSQYLEQCPTDGLPEFALIGRSNVGKSSLLNMLTGFSTLAKTSSTPGKTQLINHFLINDSWYLVDLPGYGYARVSKKQREQFKTLISSYIQKRKEMYFLFVLIDSRIEPQKIDLEFISMLGEEGVPFGLVFTKCDKQSQNQTASNIAKFRKVLKKTWAELPPVFQSSALNRLGRDEILSFIDTCLEEINAKGT